jgi:lipopolysaccharide/colanic/teichoic acid biosynthesis glycosyltransferase
MKRTFDALVAAMALVLLSPLLLMIAIAVRCSMGSPVLFRQIRPGLGGRPFTLVKFRTMREASDRDGKALPDGKRLTSVGRWLRKTSLDELPELWNVLKGEMSLVGPRPLLLEYLPLYSPAHARRHEAKPGITGWAQINGRNTISWEQKLAYDVWYVEHVSFWLDVRILCASIVKVLAAQGISQEGHETAEKFRGSAP